MARPAPGYEMKRSFGTSSLPRWLQNDDFTKLVRGSARVEMLDGRAGEGEVEQREAGPRGADAVRPGQAQVRRFDVAVRDPGRVQRNDGIEQAEASRLELRLTERGVADHVGEGLFVAVAQQQQQRGAVRQRQRPLDQLDHVRHRRLLPGEGGQHLRLVPQSRGGGVVEADLEDPAAAVVVLVGD